MRVLQGSLLLLLLLLLGLPVLTEAKRQPGQGKPDKPRQPPSAPPPARRARNRSVPGSGELSTKEGHRCTWRTSGEGLVSLQVNCTTGSLGEQHRYWCRYAGKPDQCQAYGLKSSQYWKQLVGKLKKRQNACDGEKVLKAKTCKKAHAEAHMKLVQRGAEEQKKSPPEGGKKKGGSAGKSPDGVKAERSKKNKEEEEKRRKREERRGFEEEGVMSDMQQEESYCSDRWRSICSFLTTFFQENSLRWLHLK